ncbi:Serine/arginine-rich splicing factor 33 [Platanthera zijinensis]|uniref:Serine/arginine-rich splicing factor 33 n=1 Tax=Platanthera zijinensis TaxID=2320716 RepID=A0AAP0C0N3_9ASPA
MGRYRSRSRSYSPRRYSRSPPRRKRYDDPRDRFRGAPSRSFRDRRGPPSGLLIRNISLDARPEDLRIPFERFGPVKDVYLPKNYYTGEPRGFGFVKFRYPDDAAEAKLQMNHQIIGGREISIVFAEENRKTPQDMRTSARISGRYNDRGRSPPRSPRQRYRSYSPSPSPRHDSRFEILSMLAFLCIFYNIYDGSFFSPFVLIVFLFLSLYIYTIYSKIYHRLLRLHDVTRWTSKSILTVRSLLYLKKRPLGQQNSCQILSLSPTTQSPPYREQSSPTTQRSPCRDRRSQQGRSNVCSPYTAKGNVSLAMWD